LQNLDVREAHHTNADALKIRGPLRVSEQAFGRQMLAAVDFDCETLLSGVEVEHIGSDRVLAPEFDAAYLTVAECQPYPSFGIGRRSP
jgi:hypothetical protein